MRESVEKINRQLSWDWLPDLTRWTLEQALAIQQIPAPTFHEERRAAYIQGYLQSMLDAPVETDELHNVYGLLPGVNRNARGIMLSAHMDTVFGEQTDLGTRAQAGVIYGPGLGDNSLGVAALLALATLLRQQDMTLACDVWFVATTCEEGLGDLKGMKAVFHRLQHRIGLVINLEGLAFGHVYNAGIGVRRLRIVTAAEGGHSWLHFGRASAIHGLIELGARIVALHPPQTPRTTYNIGVIEGGHSINSIATSASMWVDLRSADRATLEAFERDVRAQIDAVAGPELTFSVEVVGDRSAGSIGPDHPLIQGALTALDTVGVQGVLETGSTDANIPLAAGCPAVTIGITRGGNAHRLDEYLEIAPVEQGMRQLVLLALAAADYQGATD